MDLSVRRTVTGKSGCSPLKIQEPAREIDAMRKIRFSQFLTSLKMIWEFQFIFHHIDDWSTPRICVIDLVYAPGWSPTVSSMARFTHNFLALLGRLQSDMVMRKDFDSHRFRCKYTNVRSLGNRILGKRYPCSHCTSLLLLFDVS